MAGNDVRYVEGWMSILLSGGGRVLCTGEGVGGEERQWSPWASM